MTDKSNFTPDEWKLLLEGVMAASIAITAAEPSGLWGVLKESFAGGTQLAKAKMDEIKKNIAETWFAWSGPIEKGSAAYFRIQGPTVIIEYAPQRMGGDATKHIHTIYRDPTNDYGVKWWKQ